MTSKRLKLKNTPLRTQCVSIQCLAQVGATGLMSTVDVVLDIADLLVNSPLFLMSADRQTVAQDLVEISEQLAHLATYLESVGVSFS